jgi:hypothetical protein
MHRTDSYFRRNPSLRRFSFRRKPTRESIPIPTSTWTFNNESHEWQLLRGNTTFLICIYIYYLLVFLGSNIHAHRCLLLLILFSIFVIFGLSTSSSVEHVSKIL